MKNKYQGNDRVKKAQLQQLRRTFETLEMKEDEGVTEYFGRVMTTTNGMRNFGEEMPDVKVVEKILRSLTERFNYVVCSIEESKDMDEISVEELQSSLQVHEQKFMKRNNEDQVLRAELESPRGRGRGRGKGQSYRGRGSERGRSRSDFDMSNLEYYNCHQLGHFAYECSKEDKAANYAEFDEVEERYLKATNEDDEQIWHRRLGHMNNKSLRTMQYNQMVKGNWRSTHKFELIHTDLCGPIEPESPSGKRCLLIEKDMPKYFWPEASNWACHILNRCATTSLVNKVPEETWTSMKPNVSYFKIFGCIGFVHVPSQLRSKLEEKSQKCVFLGISTESKAYRMFDPIKRKIIISKDVVFSESERWEWSKEDLGSGTLTIADEKEVELEINEIS
nr:retrovirus-related Pol polyprotein from transposon TNT 1-94 [Tanacetum cinerariifolium]